MKILVPITYAELGGSQVFLLKLMDAFAADPEVSFSLILFQDGPLCTALADRKIPYQVMKYSVKKPWTLWPVIRKFRQENPDVIYLHAGRIFALIAKMLGIPCVERINMSRVSEVKGWCSKPWIDRICTSLNTKVLAVSAAIAQQLTDRGISKDKIVLIRNFVETERFHHPERKKEARMNSDVKDSDILVINVGRYTAQKAQQDFLRAAADALKQNPDFLFFLVGNGPREDEYRALAEQLGISGRIRFEPFCKDVEKFYHAADFMLHTAHWAPLDNVLLEAMAAGLPIIASDVDGTKEVIIDGKTGLLFDSGNTQKAAQLLVQTAKVPASAEMLGKNAYNFVLQNHTIPVVTNQFKQMFMKLAKEKK